MLLCSELLASPRTACSRRCKQSEADSDRGKEKRGNVNDYEILLMLDPELAEERQAEIVSRTEELVTKGGGNWLSHDVWGRRRLAFEIDYKGEGTYHLLQFDAEPVTLDEITRVLKITDGVMRHMATRRVKGGGTRLAPPPLPPAEAAPRYEREDRGSRSRHEEPIAEEAEPALEEPESAVAEPEAEEYAPSTEPEAETPPVSEEEGA